jgi:hypothetical protein
MKPYPSQLLSERICRILTNVLLNLDLRKRPSGLCGLRFNMFKKDGIVKTFLILFLMEGIGRKRFFNLSRMKEPL